MQVGNKKEGFICWIIGKLNSGKYGSQDISKVYPSAALNSCKYSGHGFFSEASKVINQALIKILFLHSEFACNSFEYYLEGMVLYIGIDRHSSALSFSDAGLSYSKVVPPVFLLIEGMGLDRSSFIGFLA